MERRPAELPRIAAVVFFLINFGVIISESLVIGKYDLLFTSRRVKYVILLELPSKELEINRLKSFTWIHTGIDSLTLYVVFRKMGKVSLH